MQSRSNVASQASAAAVAAYTPFLIVGMFTIISCLRLTMFNKLKWFFSNSRGFYIRLVLANEVH